MKIAKWAAVIVGGLLVLIVLAVVILTVFIDPNRFRGRIEAAVTDVTGLPFRLQGDLDIAWFPWLAVQTGPAELGNPSGVSGPPLARWQSARVGARLIPLVRGDLEIDRIRFEGLSASLRRGADGQANWDGLLASKGSERNKPRTVLGIAGLEIRNGAIDYVDLKAGTHILLTQWNFEISQVELQSHAERVVLHDIEMEGAVRGGPISAKAVSFAARIPEIKVVVDPLEVAVTEWSFKLAEAQSAGSLTARKEANGVRASGPLSVQIPSVRKLVATLGLDVPLPKDTTAMGALSLKASWAFADGALALKPIALKMDETAFSGELARSNAAEPLWTFELHGDRIDLGRYVVTEDTSSEPFELPVKALKAARVQGTLWFDQARIADADMKNARLRVYTP